MSGRRRSVRRTHSPIGNGSAREIVAETYDEVADGTELRSVILAERRLGARPMSGIGGSPMWAAGEEVRARRAERALPVDPFTAGVFPATMTAQIDEFAERGYPWSEIVNESVIEAVDSLLPYMHARLRRPHGRPLLPHGPPRCPPLGPALPDGVRADRLPVTDAPADPALIQAFSTHPMHEALAAAAKLRPSVDISVGA